MLAGSILWATWTDVLMCASAFASVGLCVFILRRPFEKISCNYHTAIQDGVRVVWWDFVFYLLIGIVITFAVRVGGVVVVFCLLVIPAIIAVMVSRSPATRLLVAWFAGVSGSLLGLLFADRLDFSVGPSVALLLGVGLVVVGSWFRSARVSAAGLTVAVVVAYVALLAAAPSRATHNSIDNRSVTEATMELSAEPPHPNGGLNLPQINSPSGFPALFNQTTEPQARCDLVLQALESDPEMGVSLALRFLHEDPPLFFRQVVVDRLDQKSNSPLGFDVTRPFADPVNRQAADRLLEHGGR